VEALGGAGDAAFLGHGAKEAQIGEIHDHLFL
jgi:hypothetical protein